jgi:23S rRNA (guanosine2251-2'-O)-methyltransferase
MQVLYGFHAVEEAVRSGGRRVEAVLIAQRRPDPRLETLRQACEAVGIPVRRESPEQLTRLAGTDAHQGVAARIVPRKFDALEDLLQPTGRPRMLLALDGIEDPHNLGALLRTADGAGIDGVVLPERRAASVTPTVVKVSAGAAEHVRIARVTNLVRALEAMKRQNIWSVGLDERGTTDYDAFDFRGDFVLVLGNEGSGLHDLVRRSCDHLLRIPMAGGVSSLNVSVAGAVVMFEAARQRRAMQAPVPAPAATLRRAPRGLGS